MLKTKYQLLVFGGNIYHVKIGASLLYEKMLKEKKRKINASFATLRI